jgi:error-prone DNA polymerase
MGFYAPAQLLRDLRARGIEVLPVDVNHSHGDVTLEPKKGTGSELVENVNHASSGVPQAGACPHFSARLGFRLLIGFSARHAVRIEQARQAGPFQSLDDFTRRTGLSRAVILQLSEADAFGSLGQGRRAALWQALAQERHLRDMPLFTDLSEEAVAEPCLPEMSPIDEVFHDYAATGLSLKAHPLSFYRSQLDEIGVLPAERLASLRTDRRVRVAGLVIMRQRPSTAKGITFVTIEDETGIANLVIHQNTWQRFYMIARRSTAWIAHGRVENKHTVIHVVIDRLEDLSTRLNRLHAASRDFR